MITLDPEIDDRTAAPAIDDEPDTDPPMVARPLIPGSHAAVLLHKVWTSPSERLILVRRDRWSDLAVVLEHLHLAVGLAIIVRSSAPKFAREIAGPILAPRREDVREYLTNYESQASYQVRIGQDVSFDVEVTATSAKSASFRCYAAMPSDVPLHVTLAAATVSRSRC